MNSHVLQPGAGADAAPGALEIGDVGARQPAADDPGVVLLAGEGRQHGAGLGAERHDPPPGLRVGDPISTSRLYGRGVRLENAARSVRRRIEADDLPDFTAETEQNLDTVLDLHATYIMSGEDGRRLVEGAAAYRSTPDETAALREAAEQVSAAVAQLPDLFSEEVRGHVAQVVQDVGDGPHPERSSQVAVTSLGNMTAGLLKWAGGAIVAGAVATSVPGTAAIAGGASAINEMVSFLISNASVLHLFAAAAGSELSWLATIAHLLDRLRLGGKK